MTQLIPQERTTECITKHSATTGVGEARPPDFAKYSAVTAVDTTVGKTEARLLEIAKYMLAGETQSLETAKNSAAAVAKCDGDGTEYSAVAAVATTVSKTEALPLEIAKYMSVVEARLPKIEKRNATTEADTVVDTTVAKSVGDDWPPRIAEHSASTAVKAVDTTGAKSVGDGEARPLEIAKYMDTTNSVLAKSLDEFHDEDGRSWCRTNGTSSAAASTVVKLADETRPLVTKEYSAVQDTGWVKRWFYDKSFGFITPKEGGEDVYIHWKQLVGTKVLLHGHSVIRYRMRRTQGKVQGGQL